MLAPKMIGWLRKHKQEYDIIHIHHPDPMAALALRLSGYRGRVILHWHSDILSQRFFLFFYRPLQNWLIRRAERIVGTTPVYVRESPHLARAQGKCTAVPIGIDPLQPDPQRVTAIRNRFPGQKLILSVGRLVPYKGYPYLIEAMALLPEAYHLVIGGTGPLKEQLKQQIQEKNLQERITLTGYLDDADLPAWFGACDCFVLTSTMKTEAFGIVQIEAMSCHKPVVATRIPQSGVAWVNEDGVSGRNVTPEKPAEYAAAIQEVTSNGKKFGESAYLRFLNRFTREQMILKIKELYEDS
jgi:rhamnosyl/mannosyltransferase